MCEYLPIIVGLKKQEIFTRSNRQQGFSDSTCENIGFLKTYKLQRRLNQEWKNCLFLTGTVSRDV